MIPRDKVYRVDILEKYPNYWLEFPFKGDPDTIVFLNKRYNNIRFLCIGEYKNLGYKIHKIGYFQQ